MKDMTGMEVAQRIREQDALCRLVFTTETDSFAVESYSVRASYYLVKPVTGEDLEYALRVCMDETLRERSSLEVIADRRRMQLLLRDILYVMTVRNAVEVYTTGGMVKVYTTYGSFAPKLLSDNWFIQCYHGCIANMDHSRCAACHRHSLLQV